MAASKAMEEIHSYSRLHIKEKTPSFMHVEHSYTSRPSSRKRCRGTPTGKTPIQAAKKAPMSSRWADEEKNFLSSYLKKEIPSHPISNEYWKNCAHEMNKDLGTNRTGASCKSFYRRFLASDTVLTSEPDSENDILALPLEQHTDQYCQTDLSFPVMRYFLEVIYAVNQY
ncbi:uncharacterized protein LOC134238986 [Saccostrea cucullata]|uniref:uncharacterized protein LOC134238986 n=1 Tax=Saccostrea cuccullata TaxID=36930 RepID=UPI002ED65F5F